MSLLTNDPKNNLPNIVNLNDIKSHPGLDKSTRPDNTGLLASTFGNTTFGESKYDKPETDSEFINNGDYNYLRGERQNGFAQLGLGALRALNKAGVEALKTPAYLYALGEWGAKNMFGDGETLDKALDNVVLNSLDDYDEAFKKTLPVYKSYKSGKGGLIDNIFSTSFWASDGADGVGYLLGMMAPGAILSKAGLAAKLTKLGIGVDASLMAQAGKSTKLANNIELGTQTLLNTFVESAAEAKGVADKLKADGVDPDKIADAARNTFFANMAVLMGPNLIANKALLGRFSKDKSILDDFMTTEGKLVAEVQAKQSLGGYAKAAATGVASEGFWEEGSQTTIENYETKKAKGLLDPNQSYLQGLAEEYVNTLTSIEGQKSIFLGAILGGGATTVGEFRENKAKKSIYPEISELLKKNFEGFSNNVDFFERDEQGKIIVDESNQPKVNTIKLKQAFDNYVKESTDSKAKDIALLEGNEDLYKLIDSQQFTRIAFPYIQKGEIGIEALNRLIDQTSNTRDFNDKKQLGIAYSESSYKSGLKQKVKELVDVYNNTDAVVKQIPELGKLKYSNPQIYDKVNSKLTNVLFQESSKQAFYNQEINKLQSELGALTVGKNANLPVNEVAKEAVQNKIKSYENLLHRSNIITRFALEPEKAKKLVNEVKSEFIKEILEEKAKEAEAAAKKADAETKQKFEEELKTPSPDVAKAKNDLNESIANAFASQSKDEFLSHYNKVKDSNFLTGEQKFQLHEKLKQFSEGSQTDEDLFKSLGINTTNDSNETELSEDTGEALSDINFNSETEDSQNTYEQEAINNVLSIGKTIKARINVMMMRLFNSYIDNGSFKFERDSEGYITLDNISNIDVEEVNKIQPGDKVELKYVELTGDALKSHRDYIASSIRNGALESDFDGKSIGIFSNDKLVGFVSEPHPARSENSPRMIDGKIEQIITPNKETEALRQNLIKYRKLITSKLDKGEKVIEKVSTKGTGNLYTKLKPNGTIDALRNVLNSSREKDLVNGTPLFVVRKREGFAMPSANLTEDQESEFQEVLASYGKKFGRKGQVFQLVRDLTNSWSLIPIYASTIGESKITEDAIISTLKGFKDNSDPLEIVKALNDYIYASTNRKGASLKVTNTDGIIAYEISGNKFYHNDIINNPKIEEQFRDLIKSKHQNIGAEKLNTEDHQKLLNERNTLKTNVIEFNGEYFVQPYIEYTQKGIDKSGVDWVKPQPLAKGESVIDEMIFTDEEPANDSIDAKKADIEISFKVDDLNVKIKNIGDVNFTYEEKTKTLTINSDIKGKLKQGYLQDILDHELFHHAFKKLTKEQKEELVKFALNSWNQLIQSNKPFDRRFIEFMLNNYTRDRSAADVATFYFLEEYLGNNIASEYNSSEKETILNNPIIKSIVKKSEFLKKEINAKYDAELAALENSTKAEQSSTQTIQDKKADIERRRQEELKFLLEEYEGNYDNTYFDDVKDTNAKYDAELDALEKPTSITKQIKNEFGFTGDEYVGDPNALSQIQDNTKLNEANFKAWLNKRLPQFSLAQGEAIARAMGDLKANKIDAFGMYKESLIYLFKGAGNKTAYHEAFHGVFRNLLSYNDRLSILQEASEIFPQPTDDQLSALANTLKGKYSKAQLKYLYYEEQLADSFGDFMVNEETKTIGQRIRDFFRRILDMFTFFSTTKESKVNQLFRAINTGQFKNAPYTVAKPSGIDIFNRETAFSIKPNVNLSDIFGVTGKSDLIGRVGNHFMYLYQKSTNSGEEIDINTIYATIAANYEKFLSEQLALKNAGKSFDLKSARYANAVLVNWNAIIKESNEYLSSRNIVVKGKLTNKSENKIEEQDDLADTIGENDVEQILTQRSPETKGLQDATSISGIRQASKRMKIFLSSIPVLDENGDEKLDTFGIPFYHDFNDVYYFIERNLTGVYTFEDMLSKMKTLSKGNQALSTVLDRLTLKPSYMNEEEFKILKSDFKTNFSKQHLAYALVKFDTDSATGKVTYKIIDSNRQALGIETLTDWESNVVDINKNTIADLDKTTGEITQFNTAKGKKLLRDWINIIKSKKEISNDELTKILYSIGVEMSQDTITTFKSSAVFKEAVTRVIEWYSGTNYNSEKNTFENVNYLDLEQSGKESLKKLVGYEMDKLFAKYTSSFNNVENKNIYTIQLPSFVSRMMSDLKSVDYKSVISELQKDPFYKNSNLLNELLSNNDYRKNGFKVSFLDGLSDERGESKGSTFTSMNPKDYLSMSIALFQNSAVNNQKIVKDKIAKHVFITPSDKTMLMTFDMIIRNVELNNKGNNIDLNSSIVKNFYNVYMSELQRIVHNVKIREDIVTKGNNSKYKLKDLIDIYHIPKENSKTFRSYVTRQENGEELSPEDFQNIGFLIKGNAFKFNYFTKNFNNKVKELFNKGLFDLNNPELTPENLAYSVDIFKDKVTELIVKELEKEVSSVRSEMIEKGVIKSENGLYIPISVDVAGKTKEEVSKNLNQLIVNFALNTKLNNIELSNLFNGDFAAYKDLQKRTYQNQSMIKNGMWSREEFKLGLVKDYETDSKSEGSKERFENIKAGLIKAGLNEEDADSLASEYNEINVTDAQMYCTPEFYKEFLIAHGEWNTTKELAHKVAEGIVDFNSLTNQEKIDIRAELGAIKPFYFGNNFNKTLNIQTFNQVKCSILPIYKDIANLNPLLANKLKEMRADNIDVLAHESTFKAFQAYRNNILSSNNNVLVLNTSNFGTQVENPQHILDSHNDSLRQLKMLLLGVIQPDGKYKGILGKDLIDKISNNEAENILTSLADLEERMSDKSSTKFKEFLRNMLTKRGATINVENTLSIVDNDFKYPLDSGNISKQMENMISSIFTKVLKQPFNVGGSGVQATSLGLRFRNFSEQDSNLPEDVKLLKQELKWVKANPETGSVEYAECVMPAWTKDFFDTEGNLIEADNIPSELRELIMYRIPTEGLHSMLPVRVVKFLPPSMGNFILLPYEVTRQFGADFDFDKMYFMGREFYKDQNGNLKAYTDTKDLKSLHRQYNNYAYQNKISKVDFDTFKDMDELYQKCPSIRNNNILDSYFTILSSIENFDLLIKPSGFEELLRIKSDYFKQSDSFEEVDFFSGVTQRDYKDRNHTGIALKGQSALHVSGHSYAVLMSKLSTLAFTSDGKIDKSKSITFNGLSATFDNIYDSNGKAMDNFDRRYNIKGELIADKLSSIMAAILDDIKDPILAVLGINKNTIDVLATIVRSGHSLETAIKFIGQPSIKHLSSYLDANSNKIKSLNQSYNTVDDLIDAYSKKYSEIYDSLNDEDKSKQGVIDPEKLKSLSYNDINDSSLELFLTSYRVKEGKNGLDIKFKSDKEFKPATELEKAYYYKFQIDCLKHFKTISGIASELIDINKFFSINKEVGPNIEDIINKVEILKLIKDENRIIKGFDENEIPTLQATWEVHKSAMENLEVYFPYSTNFYLDIKKSVIAMQSNKDITKIKTENKEYMNSFIRAYMDAQGDDNFSKFSNLFDKEHKNFEKYFVSLPKQLMRINDNILGAKTYFGDEKDENNRLAYSEVRNNLFIRSLRVRMDKNNKFNGKPIYNITIKGNRLELQVKN